MLLAKGANKLARNKKGRKPGDVFSPTVDDDKKERIKTMLGMGAAQQDGTTAVHAAVRATPAAVPAVTASSSTALTGTKAAGGISGRATAGDTVAASNTAASTTGKENLHAGGGNGGMAGGATVDAEAGTTSLPPPAYKVRVRINQTMGLAVVLSAPAHLSGSTGLRTVLGTGQDRAPPRPTRLLVASFA